VEQRNWAGLALIDRNDELCVLYEKAHVQEGVLMQAELQTRAREDEIRMLKIELAEMRRVVEARPPGALPAAAPSWRHARSGRPPCARPARPARPRGAALPGTAFRAPCCRLAWHGCLLRMQGWPPTSRFCRPACPHRRCPATAHHDRRAPLPIAAAAPRPVQVTRRQLPAVPELDIDIARLQAQLLEARRQREQLSQALEDPANTSRWRAPSRLANHPPDRACAPFPTVHDRADAPPATLHPAACLALP